MFASSSIILVGLAASAAVTAQAGVRVSGTDIQVAGDCEVVRIDANGRETRSRASAKGAARKRGSNGTSVSVSSRSGSVSASSSSSVSTAGGGRSRAVSSYTDETGRTVTTTRDEKGCTVVIDERGS